MENNKDSKESIKYRAACRENYILRQRQELIAKWEKENKVIFWNKEAIDNFKKNR
jgi:hypothetical protein